MFEAPSLLLAFAAGVVSFLSPCCLPLVPGYLAVVSGDAPGRGRAAVLARSAIFVGTFSLIFILLGLGATAIGALLVDHQDTLNVIAGIAIIVLGTFLGGAVFLPKLNRDWHPAALAQRAGRGGPVVAGAAFAIAWTPCVGPTLGAILSLASTTAGTVQGGALLAVYSAGLALPFLGTAVAYGTASRLFVVLRRHHAAIQVASSVLLVGMGVLVLTGELFRLNVEIQRLLDRYGLNLFQSV